MESIRQSMADKIEELLGDGNFQFGSYEEKPSSLPYGNYGRSHSKNYFTDDSVTSHIGVYIVRLVTENKDFDLEEQIEDIFDELEIGYDVITDENVESEHVYCVEWEIGIYER